MTKKLLSLVAVAALTTSAMAYNADELGSMKAGNNVNITGIASSKLLKKSNQLGNALLFPAYFVGSGWQTTIRVINTDSKPVVAKVVFYDGKDSHELKDFNIYLSGNDEWIGTIKVDSDGQAKLISTDDSAPVEGDTTNPNPMASADKPLTANINSANGYFEVIGMVSASKESHGSDLRKAYHDFSYAVRNANNLKKGIFQNGVVQNGAATLPYVELNATKGRDFKDSIVRLSLINVDPATYKSIDLSSINSIFSRAMHFEIRHSMGKEPEQIVPTDIMIADLLTEFEKFLEKGNYKDKDVLLEIGKRYIRQAEGEE
jgi:hypothetical protein